VICGVITWQIFSNSTRVMIFCGLGEIFLTEIAPALNQNPRRMKLIRAFYTITGLTPSCALLVCAIPFSLTLNQIWLL
jgi:hypothetical protein